MSLQAGGIEALGKFRILILLDVGGVADLQTAVHFHSEDACDEQLGVRPRIGDPDVPRLTRRCAATGVNDYGSLGDHALEIARDR